MQSLNVVYDVVTGKFPHGVMLCVRQVHDRPFGAGVPPRLARVGLVVGMVPVRLHDAMHLTARAMLRLSAVA